MIVGPTISVERYKHEATRKMKQAKIRDGAVCVDTFSLLIYGLSIHSAPVPSPSYPHGKETSRICAVFCETKQTECLLLAFDDDLRQIDIREIFRSGPWREIQSILRSGSAQVFVNLFRLTIGPYLIFWVVAPNPI